MKNFIKRHIHILKEFTFKDWVQTIGGFLIMLYIPLFIGLIWFDFILFGKLLLTNSILIGGCFLIDVNINEI